MKKINEIKTIKELADIVNENNLSILANDLTAWLGCIVLAKKLQGIEMKGTDTFKWIDDNANDVHVNVEVEKKKASICPRCNETVRTHHHRDCKGINEDQ